jgi:23S rRNA (guanosine2251-2'-O)-methyltransferase
MVDKNNFTVFEGMTSISALIKACEEAPENSRKIFKILCDEKNIKNEYRRVNFLKAKAKELDFELEFTDKEAVDNLADGKTHGGFIALCGDKTIKELSWDKIIPKGIYFLLEGIEDPYNFGYTLRALYAAGVDGVLLPERNWMSSAGTVARASAGCSELIPLYTYGTPETAVELLKKYGYRVLCANIRESELLYDTDLELPVLVVVGGEKRGISRTVLEMSDQNIRIGYGRDFSGSLPTSESAAIIAFEVSKFNNRIK